jgi:hypothetical protein
VEFQRQAEPNLLFSGKKMVKINAPKKIRLWEKRLLRKPLDQIMGPDRTLLRKKIKNIF